VTQRAWHVDVSNSKLLRKDLKKSKMPMTQVSTAKEPLTTALTISSHPNPATKTPSQPVGPPAYINPLLKNTKTIDATISLIGIGVHSV